MADETKKKLSNLPRAVELDEGALFLVSSPDTSTETGYSSMTATPGAIAERLLGNTRYETELETEAKTIFEAINEAAQTGGGGEAKDAVLYVPQTLTEEQKAQARSNIGVSAGGTVDEVAREEIATVKSDLQLLNYISLSQINPNNLFGDESFIKTVSLTTNEGKIYTSDGSDIITPIDSVYNGLTIHSASWLYFIVPIDSVKSGHFISRIRRTGAGYYSGRCVYTFGIYNNGVFGQLGGGELLDGKSGELCEWEFDIDIESKKAQFPTANCMRFGFSNGSGVDAIFYEPFFGIKSNQNGIITYNEDMVSEIRKSVLKDKSITLDGDSITKGAGNSNKAYGEYIAEKFNMSIHNNAVSGATLATGTTFSSGSPRHWVSGGIKNLPDSDYILISGGYNDYGNNVPMGQLTLNLSGLYDQTCDTNTVLGAIEQICRDLLEKFPERKIGFIFTHKINTSWRVANSQGYTMKQLHDNIVECLRRYSIPYCDLFEESKLATEVISLKTYTDDGNGNHDGVHPNGCGYEVFYVDKITSFLESL